MKSLVALSLLAICSAQAATFLYTPDGQLSQVDYGGDDRIHYVYDDSGNLTKSFGPTPLELWRYDNWLTLDSTGDASDSAVTNGINNLLRFGIGAATGDGLSSRTSAVDDGISTLTISWWERNDMPSFLLSLELETSPGVWMAYSGAPLALGTTGAYTEFSAAISYSGSAPAWRLSPTILP